MNLPQNHGRLIAVVGPSGVGKDSVMAGLVAARPDLHLVRRTITRAPNLGGEDYDAIDVEAFQTAIQAGAFCVHWGAHELFYGIPQGVVERTQQGQDCMANFSRSALRAAAEIFPYLTVLHLTAQPETLAARLAGRGRESASQIAKRLAQKDKPLPDGLNILTLSNDSALEETVRAALVALFPEHASQSDAPDE